LALQSQNTTTHKPVSGSAGDRSVRGFSVVLTEDSGVGKLNDLKGWVFDDMGATGAYLSFTFLATLNVCSSSFWEAAKENDGWLVDDLGVGVEGGCFLGLDATARSS
jgi:hypothetical protein